MIRELIDAQRVVLAVMSRLLPLVYEAGRTEEYRALKLQRLVRSRDLGDLVERARERGELNAVEAERAPAPIVSSDTAEVFA